MHQKKIRITTCIFLFAGCLLLSFNRVVNLPVMKQVEPPARVTITFVNCKLSTEDLRIWNANRGKLALNFYVSSFNSTTAVVELIAYVVPRDADPILLSLEPSRKSVIADNGILLGNQEFSLNKMGTLLRNTTETETLPNYIEIIPSMAARNPQLKLTMIGYFLNADGSLMRGSVNDLSADPSPPAPPSNFFKKIIKAKKKD